MLIRPPTPEDRRAIGALLARIEMLDGTEPLSEHKRIAFTRNQSPALVGVSDGEVVALLQTGTHHGDPSNPRADWEIEVAVDPDRRGSGVFERMVRAASTVVPRQAVLWTLDDVSADHADTMGLPLLRLLHLLERDLPAPDAFIPEGIKIETFRPGYDEDRWLAINNEAFAGHPEQSDWTIADLEARLQLDWFDSEGLFIAARRDGEPVGSVWTKIHEAYEGGPAGEIYIIAVRPSAQGIGLGKALTLTGLADLHRRKGAHKGILWVEGSNGEAFGMYQRLGFTIARTRRSFALDPLHRDAQPKG